MPAETLLPLMAQNLLKHDLAVVRAVADRLVVMDEGRVIADGAPGEVFGRPEIVEAFVS